MIINTNSNFNIKIFILILMINKDEIFFLSIGNNNKTDVIEFNLIIKLK